MRRSPRYLRSALAAIMLAVAVLWPRPGWSENSSTLAGRVADTQDRPIAQATITLSGDGFGTRHVRTDALGRYRYAALRPYTVYALTVEHAGYRTVEYYGLRPEPSRTRIVNFRLKRPGERDVVILASRDPFPFQDLVRSFMSNVDVPVRLFDLDDDSDPEEIVRRAQAEHPDLILGVGLGAARLIRRRVQNVPVILTLVTDPRHDDLAAPNLCFVAMHTSPDDLMRRVKEVLPDVRRLGVVFDAEASSLVARDLRSAARRIGLTVEIAPVYHARDLEQTLDSLAGSIDVLTVPYDPLTSSPEAVDAVSGWALRHRIPLAAPGPEWVRRGALFSYGVTQAGMGQEAASMAVQILFHDRQPIDLLRQAPPTALFAVNHETAEALGVRIPGALRIDLTY